MYNWQKVKLYINAVGSNIAKKSLDWALRSHTWSLLGPRHIKKLVDQSEI